MIEENIKAIEKEIAEQEKRITESHDTITEKKKEIEKLQILKKRLQKIHSIRHYSNIGSVERIVELANQYRLQDLLSMIANAAGIRIDYPTGAMPLMNLTVWQGLFLFFGDHTEIDKKSTPPEEEKETDITPIGE